MRIFTDPHQGLNRKAHTTQKSREKLAEALCEGTRFASETGSPLSVVCAGDLFDQHSNSEATILAAAKSIRCCDVVLAGNHDSLNESEAEGSLDIIGQLLKDTDIIKSPDFGKPYFDSGILEAMDLIFVPHQATQDIFDAAVEQVSGYTKNHWRAVFLHCNYENAMTEGSDISLNLTRAQAEKLLKVADYIFLGHEHEPRELLDGRLVILGNIHPTSFGDISDKYYYDLTATELKKTKIWDMGTGYAKIEYDGKTLPALPKEAQFIDIQGRISIDKGADLAEYISHCWEELDPLMVRNNVTFVTESHQSVEAVDFHTLPDEISKELDGTALQEKWEYYRGLVKC